MGLWGADRGFNGVLNENASRRSMLWKPCLAQGCSDVDVKAGNGHSFVEQAQYPFDNQTDGDGVARFKSQREHIGAMTRNRKGLRYDLAQGLADLANELVTGIVSERIDKFGKPTDLYQYDAEDLPRVLTGDDHVGDMPFERHAVG